MYVLLSVVISWFAAPLPFIFNRNCFLAEPNYCYWTQQEPPVQKLLELTAWEESLQGLFQHEGKSYLSKSGNLTV